MQSHDTSATEEQIKSAIASWLDNSNSRLKSEQRYEQYLRIYIQNVWLKVRYQRNIARKHFAPNIFRLGHCELHSRLPLLKEPHTYLGFYITEHVNTIDFFN